MNKRQSTIKLPSDLFNQIAETARQNRRSFNQEIISILELQLGKSAELTAEDARLALTARSETGR